MSEPDLERRVKAIEEQQEDIINNQEILRQTLFAQVIPNQKEIFRVLKGLRRSITIFVVGWVIYTMLPW